MRKGIEKLFRIVIVALMLSQAWWTVRGTGREPDHNEERQSEGEYTIKVQPRQTDNVKSEIVTNTYMVGGRSFKVVD
jgi:hypothetical protein